jgi:hypothetical protein
MTLQAGVMSCRNGGRPPAYRPIKSTRNLQSIRSINSHENQIARWGNKIFIITFAGGNTSWRHDMKAQIILAGAMLITAAAPALAADFWVVQGPDRHCQIVDKRPVTKEMTVVNPDGTTYTTRTEAETGMKTIKVCE